ncbi:MAG: hypothetical protein HY927_13490 [Elusimicrobia bacterium]|nr:hypothetical protein [Elusimicrobiota bacterium]
MAPLSLILASILAPAQAAWPASESYGAKGIFPVYDVGGEWLVFDKKDPRKKDSRLKTGSRFLAVGSAGASVFTVAGSTLAYGGACKGNKPQRIRAAVLHGPRREVGIPVIGIAVPGRFSLKGSKAVYRALRNQVAEETYQSLMGSLKKRLGEELSSGEFRLKLPDDAGEGGPPKNTEELAAAAAMKIDFGATVPVAGLPDPFVLVEGSQVLDSYRRCLRLADGKKLVGGCASMPHDLMAETSRLEFVSYDPSGRGQPFILGYTVSQPLWGHERWGFILRRSGPKLFLADSMDIRCREGF